MSHDTSNDTMTPNATHTLSDAVAAELEQTVGHHTDRLVQMLRHLERGDWFQCDAVCEAGVDLQEALSALDAAYVDLAECAEGTSAEDEALASLVAEQLRAVRRRLSLALATRAVSDIAARLGKAMCQPETLREGAADGVAH